MCPLKPAEIAIDLRGAGHSEHVGSDIVVCDVDQDDHSQRYDDPGKSLLSDLFLQPCKPRQDHIEQEQTGKREGQDRPQADISVDITEIQFLRVVVPAPVSAVDTIQYETGGVLERAADHAAQDSYQPWFFREFPAHEVHEQTTQAVDVDPRAEAGAPLHDPSVIV